MGKTSYPDMTMNIPRLSGLLASLTLTCSLGAQVLMLDFGATTVTSTDQTNSPYHTTNGAFTDSSWNQLGATDPSSVIWSDGTTATDVTVNIGGNDSAGSTILNLAKTGITNSALGGSANTGIYDGTSVGKDGIFLGSSGLRAVGFQVGGLDAGTYEIYITARNTSLSGAHVQNLYVSTSASSGNFDFSAFTTQQLSYSGSSDALGSWVVDDNYVKFTVSLGAGEFLNIASYGGTGEGRGFLNSVQIASATIPEPSAFGLLAGLGLFGCAVARRRRRSA